MTTDTERPSLSRRLSQRFAHWRAIVLLGACAGAGLSLNMMVLGSGPASQLVAAEPATTTVAPAVGTAQPPAVAALMATPAPAAAAPAEATTTAPVATAPLTAAPLAAAPVAVVTAAAAPAARSAAKQPAGTQPAATQPAATEPAATEPAATQPAPVTTAGAAPSPTSSTPPAPPPTTPATEPTTAPTDPPATDGGSDETTYPSYGAAGAGQVVLAFVDRSSISVWSVSPAPSWVYEIVRNGPGTVEVNFFNVQTHVEAHFKATVSGGRINVEADN